MNNDNNDLLQEFVLGLALYLMLLFLVPSMFSSLTQLFIALLIIILIIVISTAIVFIIIIRRYERYDL